MELPSVFMWLWVKESITVKIHREVTCQSANYSLDGFNDAPHALGCLSLRALPAVGGTMSMDEKPGLPALSSGLLRSLPMRTHQDSNISPEMSNNNPV